MDYKLKIPYQLSRVGQKNMLRDGKSLKTTRVAKKDVTHTEALELVESGLFVIDEDDGIIFNTMEKLDGFKFREYIDGPQKHMIYGGGYKFDGELSFDDLVAFFKNEKVERRAKIEEAELELARATADFKQRKAKEVERKAEREAERKAEKGAEKAKREAEKAERKAWVDQFGTEYLRDCEECGYDCQREYVIRRAEKEYPEYTVDFNETANWRDRSAPSHVALKELKKLIADGVDAKIVWLIDKPTNTTDIEDVDKEFDSCEAIVIQGYLGKYCLVKY